MKNQNFNPQKISLVVEGVVEDKTDHNIIPPYLEFGLVAQAYAVNSVLDQDDYLVTHHSLLSAT